MRENVGGADRVLRAVVGPRCWRWDTDAGAAGGALPGLLAMLGGVLITETAITRVCPLNEAAGIDTARWVRL
jgi:hypothetical protein